MSDQDTQAEAQKWADMEAHYSRSEIHNTLGLRLEIPGSGRAIVHYDGSPGATNRRGNPAGGALAEMIDSAVVMASRTLLEPNDFTTTLELKVNFVRSAEPGSVVRTDATIDHIGRTTAVGTGRSYNAEGTLIALGIVSVALRRVTQE